MQSVEKAGSEEGEEDPAQTAKEKREFRLLVLGCIGVVYGDIGTSPLYAFREASKYAVIDGHLNPTEIYGLLSLIIWALILIVTVKYVLTLLKVDNHGEGGILSLMALAKKSEGVWRALIFTAGLLGAGLFFGDACITPAISVMSAVEGLEVLSPQLEPYVLPIVIVILLSLCYAQKHGTEQVSKYFGPVTAIWFSVMAIMGLTWILKAPSVLLSFIPFYGIEFLITHLDIGFLVLGAVFLSVTGAEALYTDLGHFGRRPIAFAWLRFVFPCLIMNYLGQGAMVLSLDHVPESPFFEMFPAYLLMPIIVLATLATIIASQAVITGAFSIARQAVQMGLLPWLEIRHTSADHRGQIYMPQINRWLFYVIILLCFIFGTSEKMASAYGIAVTGDMMITTMLSSYVLWKVIGKPGKQILPYLVFFLFIEGMFWLSNITKLFQGGFLPLLIAGYVVLSMSIWVRGTRYLRKRVRRMSFQLTDLLESLERNPPLLADGTAVFLTREPSYAPLALIKNLKHNKVFHTHNIIVAVMFSQFPKVPDEQRVTVVPVTSAVTKVYVHYGFMESPDIPRALALAASKGATIDFENLSYFVGHRTLLPDPRRGLPLWQAQFFTNMANAAATPTDFYRLPSNRVVEIGIQMPI
ncbi:MAG: potassium transporter Kup [Rhodospirillales bacterium]|nr:potassium transporter Kup [Alphaproteobacteria bacterium]MCB1840553.1 potassium transporter Kup [Alphaproteobacteria bacterium]MCB9977024.1 potassium transporter Kup [Rhodospirillales bacterium]